MTEVKKGVKAFLIWQGKLKNLKKHDINETEILISSSIVPLEIYSHHLKYLFTEDYGGIGFLKENPCNYCKKKRQNLGEKTIGKK